MSTIEQEKISRIYRLIAEQLGVNEKTFGDGDDFLDLGADSLDCLEIVMAVEDEFNMMISDEEAEECHTVGHVVALVLANK